MTPRAKWLVAGERNAACRLIAAATVAGVLGTGTAIAQPPAPADSSPPRATCEVVEHNGMIELAAVMQIIAFCQDALALSEAQRQHLTQLSTAYVDGVVRRDAERRRLQDALAALLRPDPSDPGRPVDLYTAEVRIREIERLSAEGDIAALRAVEMSKAVLTPVQREVLAMLLAAPRGATSARRDL
jgi:hypothetical protein